MGTQHFLLDQHGFKTYNPEQADCHYYCIKAICSIFTSSANTALNTRQGPSLYGQLHCSEDRVSTKLKIINSNVSLSVVHTHSSAYHTFISSICWSLTFFPQIRGHELQFVL
nr:unnamed protein product [Digitaria exilis]